MKNFLFSVAFAKRMLALGILLFCGLGLGFTIHSLGKDYKDQEAYACQVATYTLQKSGYEEVCVEATIDEKLTKNKDFFHGYAILSSGEEIEFWLYVDEDQAQMRMEAPVASDPVTEPERYSGPADGVRI